MIKCHLLILLPFVAMKAYGYVVLFIFGKFRASVKIRQENGTLAHFFKM